MKIDDLKLINDIGCLYENTVVIWGAGRYGEKVYAGLKNAGIKAAYFCDRNPKKINEKYYDTAIISPQKLKQMDENGNIIIIISSIRHTVGISEDMIGLALKRSKAITFIGLEIMFKQNANHPKLNAGICSLIERQADLATEVMDIYAKTSSDRWAWLVASSILANNDSAIENQERNILVYQPGKVGSMTVYDSIRARGMDAVHTHKRGGLLNRLFTDFILNKKVKIITLVREPLARDLSVVFQTFDQERTFHLMHRNESFMNFCVREMKRMAYEDTYNGKVDNIKYGGQFDWFDYEFKNFTGIDIFSHPFDKDKAYSLITQGNIEILLMKLEKLNAMEDVIGSFLGIADFKLAKSNEGHNKSYKYLYNNLKEVIEIPRELVDLYYCNNERMDYFYGEDEKKAFLKKWNIER
jgi:hypothetical protein